MKYDLPPLNSLVAFESAARNKSFANASKELFLTQSAISFQVRNLEKKLFVKLFTREHRGVALTEEGKSLYNAVAVAFDTLSAEKSHIANKADNKSVTVSLPVSFCSKWFVPRLKEFYNSEEHTNLLIDANDNIIDINRSEFQLAIRYCSVPPRGMKAIQFIEDIVVPVCSSKIIKDYKGGMQAKDLCNMTLLEDQMYDYTWDKWMLSANISLQKESSKIKFSHSANAIDAAIAGQGIALGRMALVADDIKAGHLVCPFPNLGKTEYKYYILRCPNSVNDLAVDSVVDWLLQEAEKTVRFMNSIYQ